MSHPTDGSCIFCKIVAGQLPCFKLFEDETTIAFMDINPVNPGHALAVAKGHWPTVDVIPADVLGDVARTAQRVAKAALESCSRYLARDLGPSGIRVNLVAAGPIRTMAAKSIPGFDDFDAVWSTRAPLAWDLDDPEPAARACVALMSDWFPATTGEIIHVDGGVHSQGA